MRLPQETRQSLAETLQMLYYFKLDKVISIFNKSGLDFGSSKSAFTQGVYKLDEDLALH